MTDDRPRSGDRTGLRHYSRARMLGLLGAAALATALALPAASAARAGKFDPTFSGDGIAFTGFDPGGAGQTSTLGTDAAVKAGGEILVGGSTRGTSNPDTVDFGVAQFLPTGNLDPSFGDQGTERIDFGGLDTVRDLAVEGDGRTVVAGSTTSFVGANTQLAIMRLLPGGQPDPTFGSGGKEVPLLNGPPPHEADPSSIAVRGDGKIVVAGQARDGHHGFNGPGFVALLQPNGTPDPSFGSGGIKKINLPGFNSTQITDVALDGHGRIVLTADSFNPEGRIGLARLTHSGQFDHSFSKDGRETLLNGRFAQLSSAAATRSGALVIAGNVLRHRRHARPLIARLDADGRLDRSFGRDGVVTTTLHTKGLNNGYANAVALQSRGRVVLAGELDTHALHNAATVARLTRSGKLDRSFGHRGKSIAKGVDGGFQSVTARTKGKIVVGGETSFNATNNARKAVVARLLG